jgi:tetratricopeptide (TPR) repeat protein
MAEKTGGRKRRILWGCLIFIAAATACLIFLLIYRHQLRTEMDSYLTDAITYIEQGLYDDALTESGQALNRAERLRDNEAIETIEAHITLLQTVIRGDRFFAESNYEEALDRYYRAARYASNLDDISTEPFEVKIAITEMHITFNTLITNAATLTELSDFDSAISLYEEAKTVATALSFDEGIQQAVSGIEEVYELITIAKRTEAMNLFVQGNELYNDNQYAEALEYFYAALEIFEELDDQQDIILTRARIDYSEQTLTEKEQQTPPQGNDTQDGTQDNTQDIGEGTGNEPLSNYEHNLGIDFDLKTPIDNQSQRPANQIRMGETDGMNEGWYNGCGWIAVYNALILLDSPVHPAEIVRNFEESGGTVFDGIYGTYPNAIVKYLRSLGYDVNYNLFPQITMNLDEVIKASQVSILAYVHSSAAHYITIEYIEDIDKFVIYNDSTARTMSANLGFTDYTDLGATVDSIITFINDSPNILFSFSLIVIS